MASFINTMFVSHSPPQPYSNIPRPLPALHANVLAESESCLHMPSLSSPRSVYQSPLQRHIHDSFLDSCPSDHLLPTHYHPSRIPVPVHVQDRTRAIHRGAHAPSATVDSQHRTDPSPLSSNSNARSRGTAFQPQKRAKGTNGWQLKQFAEATLGSGSLRKVVQLPEGEDRDEWLAVNVVDFYNQINLLYGAITEFCSPQTCPEMKATDEFEYLWHDPTTGYAKPTRLPAPTYIAQLLTWTSNHLSDPALFPTQPGLPFPDHFERTVRVLFKRLYRVYAHIYCHHYAVVRALGLEAHLNTGFKHYVLFVDEFGLADEKGSKRSEWFGPLGELVESMLRSD